MTLSIPKGNEPVGNVTHLFIATESGTTPMRLPICRIDLKLKPMLFGKLLTKQVSTFCMPRHNNDFVISHQPFDNRKAF